MTDQPHKSGRRGPHRGRRLLTGAVVSGLAVLALAGWLLATGLAARNDLAAARTALGRFRSDLLTGHVEQADRELAVIQRRADSARRATSSPVWTLAGRLPLIDRPVRTTRGLTAAVDSLAGSVLPDLTDAVRTMHRTGLLGSGGTIDLTTLRTMAGPLTDASARLTDIRVRLAALPARTGIAGLDTARAGLLRRTSRLGDAVHTAVTTAHLLPGLLGADRPRHYFFALQTNAEARGTGGLVGAFSILTARHGHLSLAPFSPDDDLPAAPVPVTDLGPDFTSRYVGTDSAQLLANSNLSPHFPYAARIWTGLWERHIGRRLDGAIATDPVGLADLLAATGPLTLPNGQSLTAANAVARTERDLYTDHPDTAGRKRALTQIAQAIAGNLIRRPPPTAAAVRALTTAVDDNRLRIWSAHPDEERQLVGTPLAGILPDTAAPFAELVLNNAAAGKLDYYLRRRLTYRLGPCRDGYRRATIDIQVTNTAPTGKLPDYVTNRSDSPDRPHPTNSDFDWASVYATHNAQLLSATLDGRPLSMAVDQERGHPVYSTTLETLPGRPARLHLELLEPADTLPAITPVQPLALPQTTTVGNPACRTG